MVKEDFGEEIFQPAEPRFEFVKQLSQPLSSQPREADGSRFLRFVYSYLAVYGDPLSNPDLNPYPDGLLQRLSAVGVNGVWLHAVLRDLAPGGTAFPEFGAGHEQRLASLRALVERAKKYGIGVYLYMNEPRAMPVAFFKNRSEMAGVPDIRETQGQYKALCTSHPAVRQWMGDALATCFAKYPDWEAYLRSRPQKT